MCILLNVKKHEKTFALNVDIFNAVEDYMFYEQIKCIYGNIEKVLAPREIEILKYRYGLFGAKECTQNELADRLGISRSYVSRIEKKALGKLREVLIERKLI